MSKFFIEISNLIYFFNLLQTDGFNPLVIKGTSFILKDGTDLKTVLNAWLPALQSNLRNSASSMVAEHLRKLMTAIEMLDRNVNSKLVLTNLIINTIA